MTVKKLLKIADRLLDNSDLKKAIAQQNAPLSMKIVQTELLS